MKSKIVKMLNKSTAEYVDPKIELIKSTKDSRIGLIVPELLFKYGDSTSHIRKFPCILPWLIPAIRGRFKSYKDLKKNPAHPKKICEENLLHELQEYALQIGCHDIGYTELPFNLIFKNKSVLYSHAIILSMPMDKQQIQKAPRIKAGQEIWRIYARLGDVSNRIARFLRKRGYGAQAGVALGGDVNYPLLAQNAGMGWIGKHGLLISPEMGPSQRLAVVFTSIENLPASKENPYTWIAEFCETCNKCVKKCPSGAIYKEKPIQSDGKPQHIDYLKCIVPFSQSMGCSLCIKECVFFNRNLVEFKK